MTGGAAVEARGFAATELVIAVGVLLVPVALVVLTVPIWSERQTSARAIAREVARAATSPGPCDTSHARRVGLVVARNLGVPAGDVDLRVSCAVGHVEATVTVRMPGVHLATFGDVGAWSWTARHRQPVDVYVGSP
jgi:hypothetical protein